MKFFTSILLIAATVSLNSCGGGSSSDDTSVTVRPKTLDGLILAPDGGTISMTFLRALTEANNDPDSTVETGVISYRVNGRVQFHEGLNGRSVDAIWPDNAGQLNYTYTPINSTAALLEVTSSNCTYIIPNSPTFLLPLQRLRRVGEDINSFTNVRYFSSGTPVTTKFILNFEALGSSIIGAALRVEPTVLADVNPVDDSNEAYNNNADLTDDITSINSVSYLSTALIRFASGGAVPANYDVRRIANIDTYSSIASPSLNSRSIVFTNDAAPTADPVVLGFVSLNPSTQQRTSETGSATDISNATNAGSYLYESVVNTDHATITFTGGTQDGVITLKYTAIEVVSGNVIIQGSGGTYSIAGGVNDGQMGIFETRQN